MKKFFAREFLWLLLTIILAVPLSFLWLTSLDIVSAEQSFTEDETVFVFELFAIGYAFSFLGIYLIRFVVAAIKTLSVAAPEG